MKAVGDLHIDHHHTTEDVGIALCQAVKQALGDMKGITRYADVHIPMDEALTRVAIDISGRPFLVFKAEFVRDKVGTFDTELVQEWFQAFAMNAGITLHAQTLYGTNDHHIAESCFKALARYDLVFEERPGDRKSTRLNSSHPVLSRMPSSA